jgi:DNA-binding NarL/FixJ family response regulator
MINLFIASDNRLYSEALSKLLAGNNLFSIVGCGQEVPFLTGETGNLKPDVALIDMTMPNSCDVISALRRSHRSVKIIALAMTEDENNILDCAKRGVAGYLTRSATLEQLIKAISSVVEGELVCPRKISEILFHKIYSLHTNISTRSLQDNTRQASMSVSAIVLTQREKEIVSLLVEGKSNKEIARYLTIEISTVKNHVHNILTKLGVRSRIQAVALLQRQNVTEHSPVIDLDPLV